MMDESQKTAYIKKLAHDSGFMACGVAKATFLEEQASDFERWLSQAKHGTMQYMERHFDLRLDPRLLVEGAKSVVTLLYNYCPRELPPADQPKIAKYAYGEDYHYVIRRKLYLFFEEIKKKFGGAEGRYFVDSAPVLEKAWAVRSGLGWIGKHTNLIRKREGSFFFLAEIIFDHTLHYDPPMTTDHCGRCTRCVDACPTDALETPYELDASRCISYLTIELKGEIDKRFGGRMDGWIFGCDICQDVCPWNRFSTPTAEPAFTNSNLIGAKPEIWESFTKAEFNSLFKKSAIQRAGYLKLKRTLDFVSPASP